MYTWPLVPQCSLFSLQHATVAESISTASQRRGQGSGAERAWGIWSSRSIRGYIGCLDMGGAWTLTALLADLHDAGTEVKAAFQNWWDKVTMNHYATELCFDRSKKRIKVMLPHCKLREGFDHSGWEHQAVIGIAYSHVPVQTKLHITWGRWIRTRPC